MYDPAIGRFTGVDPISDQFAELSTYNYASNDPIKNIDLWGLQGTRADIRFNQRANDFLGGKITRQEFIQGLQNEGNGAVAGASFFIPGPEDLAIAGFAATKFGGSILNGLSRIGGKITGKFNNVIDDIFGVVPPGPGAKGSKRVKKAKSNTKIEEEDGFIGGTFNSENSGGIDFLAEKVVGKDGSLHLKDIAIYPSNAVGNESKNKVGKGMIGMLRDLMGWAKDKGYNKIRITGKRVDSSSSAKPGKDIDITRNLDDN